MITALLFLQFHSIKNRLRVRIQRLRQPKYLFGAIVGGAYFYFYFGRHFFGGRPGANGSNPFSLEQFPLELLAAFVLFIIILSAWIFPHSRAALSFTEAEVAFLFPAPISRRTLIHFKLLKSQIGILFTVLFFMLLSRRYGSGSNAFFHAAGWWIILSTLNLHFLGSSFARTLLLERGISNGLRRGIILGVVAIAISAVVIWAKNTLPPFQISEHTDFAEVSRYAGQLLASGPIPYLLIPFQIVLQPFFASDAKTFLLALIPALLLLALHYIWVIRSNVAFEEASVERSKQLAEKVAAVRAGNWQGAQKPTKKRRAPFVLQSLGLRPIALLWKNLISAGQLFSGRILLRFLPLIVFVVVFASLSKASGLWASVGFLAMMLWFMSIVAGPQMVRSDFRQDLPAVDLLKTFPMRGWQIVLGEILAPIVILSAVQWLLLILALGSTSGIPGGNAFSFSARIGIGFGVAIILPALNFISLLIPNAAVLLFPSWFQTGKDAPAGIEATGQRLIFMFGQVLVMALALAPAAGIFALIFFVGKNFLDPVAVIPIASMIAAVILAIEGSVGLMLLGKFFERFDLSEETTN
ncbi:MAG: putative ABC exporter domain-containing protein [Verrucomicrobiota bacterium]